MLALFGMTNRTLDCPITRCAINSEIRVADSQLHKRILYIVMIMVEISLYALFGCMGKSVIQLNLH